MNTAKVDATDYVNFLVATPLGYSCVEAARVQPEAGRAAHDALTRLLQRLEPDAEALWEEAAGQLNRQSGVLILDDTTLDKPYAKQMALVTRH